MKLTWKKVPKKIQRRIKRMRDSSGGYCIKRVDGTLSSERYYSKVGAAAMLMGVWDLLE